MSPRKKKVQTDSGEGVDLHRLAGIGAVSEVASLKRRIRAIEKVYPGTAAKADVELQREQMAAARAVKQAGQTGNKRAYTRARTQAEHETPTRIAAEEPTLVGALD